MENNFIENINRIIEILSQDKNLNFKHSQLPKFTKQKIITPIGDFSQSLTKQKSIFPDSLVDLSKLKTLIQKLEKRKSIIRLDHIGFCYKVDNLNEEKNRLVKLSRNAQLPLFQEPSNDDGLWLFLGDISDWQNPVIEFVPIAHSSDRNINYWLPHVQIDIDTSLNEQDINLLIKDTFSKDISPFSIHIDEITYIVRNRLGCSDGINIFLDLATNKRNVPLLRQKKWKRVE
jgi:hypothetical protein